MPDDLKAEALSKIHKQCIGCVEQYMKLLEYLDSLVTATFFMYLIFFSHCDYSNCFCSQLEFTFKIIFQQSSDDAIRSMKKSSILSIQAMLDECDKLMEKL